LRASLPLVFAFVLGIAVTARAEDGAQQILPALELALAGLKAGDTKAVTLTPEDGYGVVRPELETEKIPEDGRHAGAMLMSKGPNGRPVMVRVKEVNGDKVVLDLNHPLAGHTLRFDVKILGVE
jgi:FKBP-type peptidyl-prolyl cis-trans isomerase 2